MKINQPLRLEQIEEAFKKSPLCTLSLSSKELFHSNMIGWLLENNREFAAKLLGLNDLGDIKAEREKYNFDLLVTSKSGRKFVIENKVKSLPCRKQLSEYEEKAKRMKLDAKFILLSLMEPGEAFKNDANLKIISYEQIYGWILEIIPTIEGDEYSRALLKDYTLLLSTLISIKSLASDFSDSSQFSFAEKDEQTLRRMRLFDLAQKIRYSCLVDRCNHRFKALQLGGLEIITEPGLSRSVGLMSIKVKFGRNLLIGIQLQGNQYRLFIESTKKGSDMQVLAERLKAKDLWLNPSNPFGPQIRKFGNIFKYRYSSAEKKSVEELLNMFVDDISRVYRDREKILECLELKDVANV